jgi:hypothetical protein
MEESLSLKQNTDKAESSIYSLTTEDFFKNITQQPVYAALSKKGQDALLFIHSFFTALHGRTLTGLYLNDLARLEEDVEQFRTLVTHVFDNSAEQALIGLAERISSDRSTVLIASLLNQQDLAHVYKNASERFNEILSTATERLNKAKELENALSDTYNQQLEKLLQIQASFNKSEEGIKGLFAAVEGIKEGIEKEYKNFRDEHFKVMEVEQQEFLNRLKETTEAELETIKKPLRDISSSTVAKLNAKEFDAEATSHNYWSFLWLMISAALLVGLGFMGFRFNAEISSAPPQQVGNAIEATAFRVLLFSLGTFALVFSTRTYSSHRHNFVINRHRRNALTTFQIFANGSDDPQVKNAILLQAAQCIFSPQVSGYVRNEADTVTNTPVVNLIENLTKQSGST